MDKEFVKLNGAWENAKFIYTKKNTGWDSVVAKYIKRNGQWENIEVSPYGVVWYKTTQDSSITRGAILRTQAEFNSLVDTSYLPALSEYTSWSASIDNGSVTVTNDATNIIVGVTIGSAITSVPDYFLFCCNALEMPITFPANVRTIGDFVMGHCYNYNLPITFSEGITSIGKGFLCGSQWIDSYLTRYHYTKFNQPISFPSTLRSYPDNFLMYNNAFNQAITIPSGTTKLTGFVYHWLAFNQPVTIPNSVTAIESCFYDAYRFNKNVTIPNSVTSIKGLFFGGLWDFTSTINFQAVRPSVITESSPVYFVADSETSPAYVSGIKITGTYKSEWKNTFPDISGYGVYRKLILV